MQADRGGCQAGDGLEKPLRRGPKRSNPSHLNVVIEALPLSSTIVTSAFFSSIHKMEDVLVSDLARTCIDQFRGFLAIVRETPKLVDTDASMAIDEQVGRFNVWAGNLGVFARAHASLDYRLRDNPDAKGLALKQLEGLQDHIERGMFGYNTIPQDSRPSTENRV